MCLRILFGIQDERILAAGGTRQPTAVRRAYKNVATLQNPRNDANDIAASLTRLNFSVNKVIDGTFDDMRRALLQFGREAIGADMAVIYFSGHGMEIGGENWLIPVDAELQSDRDAESEAIPLKSAMLQAANGSNLGLVILDACRNNPFAAKMQRTARYRSVDRGLVRVEPSDNVLVAYAAREGTVASDGDGQHSPFTAALLSNLETPGLEINFLFRTVRDEVLAATKREQQPFVYGSLSKRAIYLKEPLGKGHDAAPSNTSVQTEAITTVLAFEYDTRDGWTLKNIGREPVLDIIVAERSRTGEWTSPVRVPPLGPNEKFVLNWLGHSNVDILGATYRSGSGRVFSAICENDLTKVEAGNKIGDWPDDQISRHWNVKTATVASSASPASPGPCGSAPVTVSLSSRSAKPLSAAEECSLKPKDEFKECNKCPEMIVVPSGSLMMGSPSSEPERFDDEEQVRVTIAKPFAVGKYAVTFDEWDACVADGGCDRPSDNGWGRGRRPVINVDWDDAQKYVSWISNKTRKIYRLLSEAEREYVTRARTTTPFWWGTSITPKQANYNVNADMKLRGQTLPVDSFAPNPWRLYNVHGNVWEWLQDCWNDSNSGNPGDGSARDSGVCFMRSVRGGSWYDTSKTLRAACRKGSSTPGPGASNVGFRLARTLTP